jgi:hypothetical protein
MEAMLGMKKLEVAKLEAAYTGPKPKKAAPKSSTRHATPGKHRHV